jgi:hypothetical protein
MSTTSNSITTTGNPFATAFVVGGAVSLLVFTAFLYVLGVPLTVFVLLLIAGALLWLAFRYPTVTLGLVLAFMPIYPLAFLLAKFFGPAYLASFEGADRIVLLFLTCLLWWRNGITLKTPDWFILACFGLSLFRLAFDGKLLPLLSDFNLMIAYAAGRVAVLTVGQEKAWATRAVWITAILAAVGLPEVFLLGEGPRTLLYLSVAEQATSGGELNGSFHAFGYLGLRESSTMLGPLHFAPLCMAGLLIWWVYFRNPLPGVMIAVGLICTVTRSAWLGTAVSVPLVAIIMGQTKRLLLYGGIILALFVAAIPVLGLRDYLTSTKTVEDPSAEDHQRMIYEGLDFVSEHPLGVGPGNAGRWALEKFNNANSVFVDDTYLTFASEYGIPTVLCFIGFLVSATILSWRQHTRIGYVAFGILVGFSVIMTVFDAHDVFPLATWIWFPVGMAVRSSTHTGAQELRETVESKPPELDSAF